MPAFRSARLLNIIALLCVAAVALALVSQHVFDMPPCAWCVFQRLLFLAIAAVCWLALAAGALWQGARRLGALLVVALAAGGVLAAWYQITVASQMFSCAQTFADQFMVSSGLDAALPWLFGIYATCAEARVELLGIEYAWWSMGLFVIVALMGLAGIKRRA